MKWFEIKEQSAGTKRLFITWIIFKIFGAKGLYILTFFVAFFTFVCSKNIRSYSKKYLSVIEKYTKIKPSLMNQFKHIYSYALSLADKIILFSGNYNPNNIIFNNENDKIEMLETINQKKGVFFICSHIGNIEMLQSLFTDKKINTDFGINVFMSNSQSQIFNKFLDSIKIDMPINIFKVEEIGLNTGIELKENLDKGDIVFIAGDRLSANNGDKTINSEIFNHRILLPLGTFTMAKLMNVPIYFISVIKNNNKYNVYLQKSNNPENITQDYANFLEKMTLIAPFQFYHFYDFFE